MADTKDYTNKGDGVSRRSFLKGVGITSVGVAAISSSTELLEGNTGTSGELIGKDGQTVTLNVNGKNLKVKAEPRMTLAEVLRDHLHMTGTKVVCDRGACGACTVIMDGQTVTSCMTLVMDAVGTKIETIEGLETSDGLHPLQKSFVKHDALQCGFCTPGMVMSCKNLLDHNPSPNLKEVKKAVCGNLCRCGTYPKVFDAVMALSSNKGE